MKELASKASVGETLPWVQIPPSPPFHDSRQAKHSDPHHSVGDSFGNILALKRIAREVSHGKETHSGASGLRAKSFAELVAEAKVVAKIVDERLPLLRIHIVFLEHEVFADVNRENLNLNGCTSA